MSIYFHTITHSPVPTPLVRSYSASRSNSRLPVDDLSKARGLYLSLISPVPFSVLQACSFVVSSESILLLEFLSFNLVLHLNRKPSRLGWHPTTTTFDAFKLEHDKMSLMLSDNLAPQPVTDIFTSDTNIDRRKCHRTVPMKVLALGVGRTGTACMSSPGRLFACPWLTRLHHQLSALLLSVLDTSSATT